MEDKFRITLFDTSSKRELTQFDFPILPKKGDSIDLNFGRDKNSPDYFVVQSCAFSTNLDEGLIEATLYGVRERYWSN